MKVIIDVPIINVQDMCRWHKEGICALTGIEVDIIAEAIVKGMTLPDNATNGDVIKVLFPNIEQDKERLRQKHGSKALYDTYEKWCELPYKVGDTDGNS